MLTRHGSSEGGGGAIRTTLTALFHGDSGVGKSWFADTVPGPRLILDAEGRARYTPSGPKIMWDPKAGPPPVYDGTWQTCIVQVVDFETIRLVYTWLRSGQHPFVSVVIDSLMEAQKRCIDAVAGVNALDQQDWGTLLRHLEGLVRNYRDLTLLPDATQTVQVVIFVVGSRNVEGKMKPLLQGQLQDTVPFYIDVVGYLYKQPVTSPEGLVSYTRQLLIDQQPGFVAKDNTGYLVSQLGPVVPVQSVDQPGFTIASLLDIIHQSGQPMVVQEGATA